MRSFSSVAALLLCTGLASQQAEPLRVMTFNIRYGTARDGANHWKLRRDNVTATIRDYRPHLVGVQEALGFQVDYLMAALKGYEKIGVGRDREKAGEYSCILVDQKRLSVTRSDTFWLSATPDVTGSKGWDAALPRICTWAVLRDKVTGSRFVHFNTHFDHRGVQSREHSALLIRARLKRFPGLPILVTGDLNASEDSSAVAALKARTLRDTFRTAHREDTTVGTFNGFKGQKTGKKVDYVFASAHWRVHAATIDRREFDGLTPSDHYPVTAELSLESWNPGSLMPVVASRFWHITRPVDLGELQGERQQAVDHAIFRSDDGKWHVWSCIRGTKIGRLLYAWRGDTLVQHDWQAQGIAMRAEPKFGESIADWNDKEWIQAPHVVIQKGVHHMLYGGHRTELGACQVCLATSPDGNTFVRHSGDKGFSRVFTGPGEARDPMTIRIGDKWYCYYTGHDEGARAPCKIYARTSRDLVNWSEPITIAWGGSAGSGNWSAECPFVVEHDGFYYLFRTTSYTAPLTHVYRSADPENFGHDEDSKMIGTIPVAAPEIVLHAGKYYISSVHDLAGGIQLARLEFVHEDRAEGSLTFQNRFESLWNFEDGTLNNWMQTGDAFKSQPTYTDSKRVRGQSVGHEGNFFIGTYESRPDRKTPADSAQGDAPRGTLRSPDFTLPHSHVSFLLAGGRDAEKTFVALILNSNGQELYRASGYDSNRMRRVIWDVTRFASQKAHLLIVDDSGDSWGHVNFDDFRLVRK